MEKKIMTDKVMQIAILCRDIEKTTAAWADFLGVDMPKIITTAPYEETQAIYRGEPCKARIYQSFFSFNNVQFELISPMDDTPSVWLEYLEKNGEGLHHIAFGVKNMNAVCAELDSKGMPAVARGEYKGGRYAYIDSCPSLTLMLELLEND